MSMMIDKTDSLRPKMHGVGTASKQCKQVGQGSQQPTTMAACAVSVSKKRKRPQQRRISDISGEEVQNLIRLLSRAKSDGVLELPPMQDLWNKARTHEAAGKHLSQEVSLFQHLKRLGVVEPPGTSGSTGGDTDGKSGGINGKVRCVVDFGCGSGRLSDYIHEHTKCRMHHILIDRQRFKKSSTRDSRMFSRVAGERVRLGRRVTRLEMDIRDLDLTQHLPPLASKSDVVGISKHLCGAAFDLTLSALDDYNCHVDVEAKVQAASAPQARAPFLLVPCCHYLCTYEDFAGKECLARFGIGRSEFEALAAVTQWATIKVADECPPQEGSVVEGEAQLLAMTSADFRKSLRAHQKRQLARACKAILNYARAEYCRHSMGYKTVETFRYTTSSPEATAVLGK